MRLRWVAAPLLSLALVGPAPVKAEDPRPQLPVVKRITIDGNRKVEDAAIQQVLSSKEGQRLNRARIAADVRAIWAMGKFEDITVKARDARGGVELIYVVKEKPSVRKIIVGGNDELELDKINEVLDLKREGILDVAKIKRNVEKIRDLYIEKGFYLAEVKYRLRKVSSTQVDIIFEITENA